LVAPALICFETRSPRIQAYSKGGANRVCCDDFTFGREFPGIIFSVQCGPT